MLIGYVRVSKSDGTQTLAPQRDAMLAAGVICLTHRASVSLAVRPFPNSLRRTSAPVSINVPRKPPLIARRGTHHCAPLHLPSFSEPTSRSMHHAGLGRSMSQVRHFDHSRVSWRLSVPREDVRFW